MRLLLILIVIAAIFAVVQSQRHGCSWGQEGWFDCVIGKSATETPTTAPAMPEPATPAPAPEMPNP